MKKLLKFIVLPIMLLSCMLVVSACQTSEDKIEIHTPFKTVYYVGEDLDVTGGILNYTKNGNTTQVAITADMVQNFSSNNIGTFTLIINYNDLTTTIQYTISGIFAVDYNDIYIGTNNLVEDYLCLQFFPDNKVGLDFIENTNVSNAFFPPAQVVDYKIYQDAQGFYAISESFGSDFEDFDGIYLRIYNVTPSSLSLIFYFPNGDICYTFNLFVN